MLEADAASVLVTTTTTPPASVLVSVASVVDGVPEAVLLAWGVLEGAGAALVVSSGAAVVESLAGRVDVVVSAGACAVVVGCCVVSGCCCCVVVVVGCAWLVVTRVVEVVTGAALVVSALFDVPLPPEEPPVPLVEELPGVTASPTSKVGASMTDRLGRAGWRCERCASQRKRKKCGLENWLGQRRPAFCSCARGPGRAVSTLALGIGKWCTGARRRRSADRERAMADAAAVCVPRRLRLCGPPAKCFP